MKKLSWEETNKAVEELAKKIKTSGFKPDYLIGITTGGLIPLALLSKELKIDKLLTVSANSSGKDKNKKITMTYLPEIDLKNQKILLVDEIVETGITLKKISEAIVSHYKLQELKTATLGVNKDKCIFFPDFYVIVEQGYWVIFLWEKEDFPKYSTD